MKNKIIIILCLSLLCLISLIAYRNYLIQHPIKLIHYWPTLTTKIPILKVLDNVFSLTAGIEWYKVRNKKTGKEYLMRMGFETIKEGNRHSISDIYYVMDNEKRDRWVGMYQRDFYKRFGSPSDGVALQAVTIKKIAERKGK